MLTTFILCGIRWGHIQARLIPPTDQNQTQTQTQTKLKLKLTHDLTYFRCTNFREEKLLRRQKFGKFLHFAWINFREWSNFINFARINFCEWLNLKLLYLTFFLYFTNKKFHRYSILAFFSRISNFVFFAKISFRESTIFEFSRG